MKMDDGIEIIRRLALAVVAIAGILSALFFLILGVFAELQSFERSIVILIGLLFFALTYGGIKLINWIFLKS